MAKLDRLVWAAGISFNVFGARIGLRVNQPDLLDAFVAHLPIGWKPETSNVVTRMYSVIGGGPSPRSQVRPFSFLYADVVRVARTVNVTDLYEPLESDIDFYVAESARNKVFVHAGVVAWKGKAIVIPGRSHSGKTTLVKALLHAGATYFSDEFAVLDGRGRVHPFPRRLSIRGDSEDTTRLSAESLGSRTGAGPLPIGLLALTRYQTGARWKPRVVSAGKGTLGLLANTLAARTQPRRALSTLTRAVRTAPVLAGTRGEAEEAASSILRLLG
jgi:hypothetical protein